MATVGVLCARGRVEEKALMAALAEAGIVSALFPPADEPLPVGPLPVWPDGRPFPVPQLVVDRHPNRQIARAVLSSCRALGVPALSAGTAGTGDRLDVASALAAAGLPRPVTALCTSEAAALEAVKVLGLPATLLPLDLHATGIALVDVDTAEAVLEHRAVLGGAERSLGLLQAGAPAPGHLLTALVVDGRAVAVNKEADGRIDAGNLLLAEEAARALGADLVAVSIVTGSAPMVWDVQPVPEYRHMAALGGVSVGHEIARAVEQRLAVAPVTRRPGQANGWLTMPVELERMRGGVVVSA